jgi:hypothetical protein
MKKISKSFIQIIYSIIFFILGFLIAKLFDIPKFSIDYKVNIVHFISIFITLVLALIINDYFLKQNNASGKIKELLYERTQKLVTLLEEIKSISHQQDILYTTVVYKFKIFYTTLNCTQNLFKKTKVTFSKEYLSNLNDEYKKHKDLWTNTPVNGKGNAPLKIKNNILHISSYRNDEIEEQHTKMIDLLSELEIDIIQN